MSPEIEAIIIEEAKSAGVDVWLALAIAQTESAGDHLAVRFEPRWKYYFDVPQFAFRNRVSQDTERALQSVSWGLMQVMGSVCRELHYVDSLIKLGNDPRLGAKYGCMKLAQLMKKYPKLEDAIASYNAGSPRKLDGRYVNQDYVDKVKKVLFKRGKNNGMAQS